MKFAESVKNMVEICIGQKDIDDLGIVWRVLKNILYEYSKLKKESL